MARTIALTKTDDMVIYFGCTAHMRQLSDKENVTTTFTVKIALADDSTVSATKKGFVIVFWQ